MDKTAAQVAAEALALLDRKGWCKNALQWRREDSDLYPQGSHCLAGAVNMAMHGDWMWGDYWGGGGAYLKLAEIIREQFPDRIWQPEEGAVIGSCLSGGAVVVEFNNHDDTTLTDVRLVLEKLAAE